MMLHCRAAFPAQLSARHWRRFSLGDEDNLGPHGHKGDRVTASAALRGVPALSVESVKPRLAMVAGAYVQKLVDERARARLNAEITRETTRSMKDIALYSASRLHRRPGQCTT